MMTFVNLGVMKVWMTESNPSLKLALIDTIGFRKLLKH